MLNCGYGTGYSVLDVIDAVKRASGSDFAVRLGPRRPGDPATLIAQADPIGEVLGWVLMLDDLDTIVESALGWEQRLIEVRAAS